MRKYAWVAGIGICFIIGLIWLNMAFDKSCTINNITYDKTVCKQYGLSGMTMNGIEITNETKYSIVNGKEENGQCHVPTSTIDFIHAGSCNDYYVVKDNYKSGIHSSREVKAISKEQYNRYNNDVDRLDVEWESL